MASLISKSEFKDALTRYPSLISNMNKKAKIGTLSLQELDEFRYEIAPTKFNKSTGDSMNISEVSKLIDWKMRHGTFRPSLSKLVSSNSNDELAAVTKNAFDYYANHENDIAGTLDRLAKPLKGIGPAAASLLLSIHDPQNVIYFSDELYRWLCANGSKVSLKYTMKEFQALFDQAKIFISKINCTPIELEKVAYVLVKEQDSSSKLELKQPSLQLSEENATYPKPEERHKNLPKKLSSRQNLDTTINDKLSHLNPKNNVKKRQRKPSKEDTQQVEKKKIGETAILHEENKKDLDNLRRSTRLRSFKS